MEFMTFSDMLHYAAWRQPDQTFIYWSDRKKSVTYAEGEELSTRIAGNLASLGITKGDRVGLFAHNGLDYVLAMFAIWKLGAISAHISVLQKDNLQYFINDSSPKALIYTGDMHPVIETLKPLAPSLEHYICFDGARDFSLPWSDFMQKASPMPKVKVGGSDPAHLSYTSGSSGAPKGALLAHGFTARATHTIAERLDLGSDDVSLGVTSLSSSFHLVANLLPGVHRCVNIGVRKNWDPSEVWQEMEDRRVSILVGNPLVLGDLLREADNRGKMPGSFERCVSGGAPVPPALKKSYLEKYGVFLVESYGQSELGGFLALGYPKKEPESRFFAIGPGLPDRETIVADENGSEQPVGEPGELVIRGGVMIGYWNMPEKTSAVIRNEWLHTGDMGVMDRDGYFTLLGRWSERIQVGKKVIYPRYMEEALLRHASVHYAGVIGKKHHELGQIPLAVVELYPDQKTTPEELLKHCRTILPQDECPYEIIVIPQMPMTPTGKIGKQELIRLFSN